MQILSLFGENRLVMEILLKMSWLDCADNLFQDFDSKDAMIQRSKDLSNANGHIDVKAEIFYFKTNKKKKDLSISRNTIKERMLNMNSNIENQLIHELNQSSFFSICIDASTDITSHRLCVFQ